MNIDVYSPYRVDLDEIEKISTQWDAFAKTVASLPQSVGDVFYAPGTIEFLMNLAEEFRLIEKQAAELSRIVRDVLLGVMYAGDMTSETARRLQVPPETAQAIRTSIVNDLFKPAIEDIKKIQREKFPDRTRQNQPQATPLPTVGAGNTVDLRNQK